MTRIEPCLWFDGQAEEAAAWYVSIFRNARILSTTHYGEGMPRPAGSVLTVRFELDGETFLALNGGPEYTFSPAVSFIVPCDSQAEIDHYWSRLLSEGGQPQGCGWLQDRYGVTWQIVPRVLTEMVTGGDTAATQRVLQAMMPMVKLDIAALERAYAKG